MINSFDKEISKNLYIASAGLYGALCFFLSDFFCIGLNPDLIAYLNIAKKYSEGHFYEASNGYWSPLVSWLLVPFFWMKADPLVSFKLINFLSAIVLLRYTILLMDRLQILHLVRYACLIVVISFCAVYSISSQTPDFISILFFVIYLYVQTNPGRKNDPSYYIKIGVSAAFCFFVKSYFFAFFIIQFFLVNVFDYIYTAEKEEKKRLLITACKSYAVFFLIAGIWVAAISNKYQQLTITSASKYNSTVFSPKGDTLQYTSYAGLIPPADKYAVSGWEDPGYFKVKERKVFDSVQSMKYQLGIIQYNTKILLYMYNYFSFFGAGVLLVFVMIFLIEKTEERHAAGLLIFSSQLFILGYYLIFIKERYLMPAHFLMIIGAFYILNRLIEKFKIGVITTLILSLAFLFAFIKNPFHMFRLFKGNGAKDKYPIEMAYELASKKFLANKRIATPTSQSGLYNNITLTAFLSGAKFYGELGLYDAEQVDELSLEQNKIDYFFYYDCSKIDIDGNCLNKEMPFYLKGKEVVYRNPTLALSIYKLR